MTRTTLRVLLFGASMALAVGTGCSDDSTFFPDAGDGGSGGENRDGGTGGGGGGGTDSDAGGNPSLDVSIGDDTGGGGGGTEDTGGGGGGTTDLDCVEIIDCINASGGTQADLEACIDQGTPEAQGQITDILICLQENCGEAASDEEFASCQQEFCSAEIAACTGQAAPSGDANCEETVMCALGCADQECANACISDADSTETAQAAIDYFNCGVESCAEATSAEEFLSCADAACPGESAACF